MRNRDENYPLPYEHTTFWKNVQVRWSPMKKAVSTIKQDDLALYFASSGYYRFVIEYLFSTIDSISISFSLVVNKQLIALVLMPDIFIKQKLH